MIKNAVSSQQIEVFSAVSHAQAEKAELLSLFQRRILRMSVPLGYAGSLALLKLIVASTCLSTSCYCFLDAKGLLERD